MHTYTYNVNNNDNIVSLTSHNVNSYNTTCYLYSSIPSILVEEVEDIVVDEDINRAIDVSMSFQFNLHHGFDVFVRYPGPIRLR